MVFMQRYVFITAFFILVALPCFAAESTANASCPVIIDYFYEAGCADCFRVKNHVMPDLKEIFEGFYVINNYDVGVKSNIIRLATYQEKVNIVSNKPVMMVVDYKYVFNGFDAIKASLLKQMDECIAERQEANWKAPEAIEIKDGIVENRIEKFTVPIVMTAGFLDGLNPCAIASLVFFMSLLAVAKIKGRGLMLMGISFCLASFLTYTALGFGLLRALHLLSGFPMMRHIIDIGMIAVLGIFALMSFRDAYRYRMTGDPDDVTLQLPESIKLRIRRIMRWGMGKRDIRQNLQNEQNTEISMGAIAVGGIIIGTLVTALESICTGQMYVPTLVVMAKSGMAKAWGYLLLYNLMFILPLVVVFILTYFGLRTPTLLEWSKKNVVISKVLLGSFFLVLAVLVMAL
ncbi:MAG: hypothetical protein A2283_22030 [Lentisphaerae bacterium RIFOXYA12_FULL_48_11]|nr:MAG: hypothetical protein A2283_22030 [Lentisphaerae bacterium RIFOXYA12_FULL_48_11]